VEKHQVVIIGSGPAGIHRRDLRRPGDLKLSCSRPAAWRPAHHHHRRGELFRLPEGILGPEMMELFRAQAERFGTTIIDGMVTK